MKTCSKCKVEKDEAEFSKDKNSKDGFDSRCKSCVREYRQTDAYKEYQKSYKKAYRQADAYKEKTRDYKKAYRLRKKAAAAAGNATPSSDTQTIRTQE